MYTNPKAKGVVECHNASSLPTADSRPSLTVYSFLMLGVSMLLVAVPFNSIVVLPGVSVVRAIGILVSLVWVNWVIVGLVPRRGQWSIPRTNVSILALACAFVLAIGVSFFYASPSPYFGSSLATVVSGITMAVIISSVIRSDRALRRAYACLVLGGGISGCLVIAQFVAPQSVSAILSQIVFTEGATVWVTGPFRDPNFAAFILIMLMCFTLYLTLTFRSWWWRVPLYVALAVQLLAVIMTFSRAGYLTLGFVTLIILWREKHRFHFWKTVLMSGILCFALLAIFGGNLLDDAVSRARTVADFASLVIAEEFAQAEQLDRSLWYRLNLMMGGIRMAVARFPIGVGWENFRFYITTYFPEVLPQGAHNMYVGVASELGLLGFVVLVCFLWLLWRSTSAHCKVESREITLLVRGMRYALLTVLVNGAFLGGLHEPAVWALIGLIMAKNQVVLRTAKAGQVMLS